MAFPLKEVGDLPQIPQAGSATVFVVTMCFTYANEVAYDPIQNFITHKWLTNSQGISIVSLRRN